MPRLVSDFLSLFSRSSPSQLDVISVLLPYRDCATTLMEAAKSVLADMGSDDELLLIDDGSKDGSHAVAESLADPRVVRLSTGGVGIAGALQRGLRSARGEWIARMDGDDVSLPGRLRAERELLEADDSLGVVATQVDVFGTKVGDGVRRYVDWQNGLVSCVDHARNIYVESPICHPSTMLRRAALDAVGGFAEGPFAEDYDLWLRLIEAGWQIAKVPRVLFRWRMHDRNVTWTDPRLSIDSLRRLRARHLARRIDRVFCIWGAGREGRRLSTALAESGRLPAFFMDIDPLKIGRKRRGAPILEADEGMTRAKADGYLVIVAVAVPGSRQLIRARLEAKGFVEGRDFLCAA